MAFLTLADLAALQNSDVLTGLIEDVTTYAPEFNTVPAKTKPGTSYYVTRRTSLPTASFRSVNAGATPTKSAFQRDLKEMFFLDCPLQVDEAIVKGDDASLGDVLSLEARAALQASINTIGSQFYYGTSADASGFVGLRDQTVSSVAAGGTTNTTSAYLVWLDPQGVQFVVGRDGEISLPSFAKQQVVDPNDSAKRMMAYVSNLSSYIGLQVGSNQAVWSITGVETASTRYVSDARGAQLLKAVPMSRRSGLRWFMNRTAAYTLQLSRSAIGNQVANKAGLGAFSQMPEELCGIPITVTDSLVDTETNS